MSDRPTWKRFTVEGLVIVVSILLAFGVDALWDRAQRADDVTLAIEGLTADFRENVQWIAEIRSILVDMRDRFAAFREMPIEEVRALEADPDSAALYGTALWGASSFDSQEGTLQALISSSSLDLVADADLRAKLLRWSTMVVDSREEVLYMKNGGNEVTRLAAAHGGPWSPFAGELPHLNPPDLVAARMDEELMAAAANTRFWCDLYLFELLEIEALAGEILEELEAVGR